MKFFLDIARLLPASILLTFAVIAQSIGMAHASSVSPNPHGKTGFDYIICADGELKTLSQDNQGNPLEHQHNGVHCPLCVLGKAFDLGQNRAFSGPTRDAFAIVFIHRIGNTQVDDMQPDTRNGQDPPLA